MKIRNRRLVWSREAVDAAVQEGWDAALLDVRDHPVKVIGTTENMAVLKEQNGRVSLVPFHRITDMWQGVAV